MAFKRPDSNTKRVQNYTNFNMLVSKRFCRRTNNIIYIYIHIPMNEFIMSLFYGRNLMSYVTGSWRRDGYVSERRAKILSSVLDDVASL